MKLVIVMSIGERIKKLRKAKGISQVTLAKATGVSKQSLYKYENDIVASIPSDKIEAIAEQLSVSPAYIMGWDDEAVHLPRENSSTCTPQETANLIKTLASSKGIAVSKLLQDCELNKNAIFTMQSSGYFPRVESLTRIADHLNVSVDYLLGRTDDPVLHKKPVTFTVEDEPLYVVKFAGRNGKFTEEYMTAQQIEELKKKIEALPEADF